MAAATSWRLAFATLAGLGLLYADGFAGFVERVPTAGDTSTATASPSPGTASVRDRIERALADVWQLTRIPLAWWVLGLVLAKLLFTLQSCGVRTYLPSVVVARTGVSTGVANGAFSRFLAGSALATVAFGALASCIGIVRTFPLVGVVCLVARVGFLATRWRLD